MPDNDKLTPADSGDLVVSIALALTSGSRLARVQSAEVLATVVAERIVEELIRPSGLRRHEAAARGRRSSASARVRGLAGSRGRVHIGLMLTMSITPDAFAAIASTLPPVYKATRRPDGNARTAMSSTGSRRCVVEVRAVPM